MSPADEGVVKFQAAHRDEPLSATRFGELARTLIAWREILARLGLIGQDAARYGGAGYGNVSGRIGPFPGAPGARAFLITGTQTGGRACMSLDDFCVVSRYDVERNRVESFGSALPSSESMTHGAIYDLGPHLRWVLHVHCPVLWRQAERLRLPLTARTVPYGTPEMAREVRRLHRETALAERRILAMGGHEDGIVVFGENVEAAGGVLMNELAKAWGNVCMDEGRLCRPR